MSNSTDTPQPRSTALTKLHVRDDEGEIITVSLTEEDRDEITVGRDRNNTVQLRDITVSRHHARMTRVAQDSYTLEDLSSYNGVLVNGERIQKPMNVGVGDRIVIGSHQLWFERADGRGSFDCPTIRLDHAPLKPGTR